MAVTITSVVWQACIDEERCISIFGKKYCIRITGCIRILFENNSYYLEIEAFGNRWRWNLSNACYTFWTVGIASFKICANPTGGNGVHLALEGCLGVDSISKCWTIYAADVKWFKVSELKPGEAEILGISKQLDDFARGHGIVAFGSVESPLTEAQIQALLSAPEVR